ncbi:MAG: hypothetical protein VX871_09025 [Pseudomonadota bacterium]|nr:hypothetical protein [Pseudomonadota bacterium]
MNMRFAALAVAALALAGPAMADQPQVIEPPATNAAECAQLADLTKKTAAAQADQGPKTRALVDKALGELDASCAASKFREAGQAAAFVRGLVAGE